LTLFILLEEGEGGQREQREGTEQFAQLQSGIGTRQIEQILNADSFPWCACLGSLPLGEFLILKAFFGLVSHVCNSSYLGS
jgi:hypothetical protein